jgi:ABC-2 type transport system ATP-binding protein
MESPAIEVRGLRKQYGDIKAVDGIDLAVADGEIFALLGPNGAGKTTTVEILEGYRHRGGGQVRVLGVDPGHADRKWRARIGVVLDATNDLSDMSVSESIRHFARYYPNPRDPGQVIARVGLLEKEKARVGQLSRGQRRRLDVALGIIGRPRVLFLDEPTTGFDPEARRRFWDLIKELAADGTTILMTTHYLEEAAVLARQVAIIVAGRIMAQGDPRTLGGRADSSARVSWREDGTQHTIETRAPADVVAELVARFGGDVPDLSVSRPSLEDVYLSLIEGTADGREH